MDETRKSGRPPIGERAMTNAECVARWRERHARRLARKTPYRHKPFTLEDWDELRVKPDDVGLDDEGDEVMSATERSRRKRERDPA